MYFSRKKDYYHGVLRNTDSENVERVKTGFMSITAIKQWLTPKVTEESRKSITEINIRLIGRVSPIFLILTTVLLVVYSFFYIVWGDRYRLAVLSVAVCALFFFCAVSASRHWNRDADAGSKAGTGRIIEVFYWLFSVWGVLVSWRMYIHQSQMMIMDTVQIGFMVLVCCYPLWGAVRIILVYLFLYILLLTTDGAAQINTAIYWLMPAMICFGTVIRYGMELKNIELVRDLTKYSRSLENTSSHDELTGMKNRTALRDDFPSYCGKPVWVIMSDVDHFKRYNDTYGHEIGDRILIAFANEIMNLFGKTCSYRYGGDEFLIILTGYSQTEITTMLTVWTEMVGNIRLEELPEEDDFSCSYGYVGGTPADEPELRKLVVLADKKLYEMKRSR